MNKQLKEVIVSTLKASIAVANAAEAFIEHEDDDKGFMDMITLHRSNVHKTLEFLADEPVSK